MYECAPCARSAYTGQERVWHPLELELQKIVSLHVDARNQSQVSPVRVTSVLNCLLSHLSSPATLLLRTS